MRVGEMTVGVECEAGEGGTRPPQPTSSPDITGDQRDRSHSKSAGVTRANISSEKYFIRIFTFWSSVLTLNIPAVLCVRA